MTKKQTWQEFRDSGLLWWINRSLHLFGWAIVFEIDKSSGAVTEVYPAKVDFRGFNENDEAEGFRALTSYMQENAGSNSLIQD